MGWPAVRRFGTCAGLALAAVSTACWSATPAAPTAPPENRAAIAAGPEGAYWCSISESGYDYERFGCVIKRTGSHLQLTKLGGSQRFTGRLTPNDRGGLAFDGKFFCPYGACDSPFHGVFRPDGRGELLGTFTDRQITVTLVPATTNALAAAGYGGAGYGGGGYGGNSYGGGTIPRP